MRNDIRAVLFDAVGTLIYPDPSAHTAYFHHGRRFGSKLQPGEIAERFPAAFARRLQADIVSDAAESGALARRPTNELLERRRWQTIVAEVFDDVADAGDSLFEALWSHFAQPDNWALYNDAGPVLDALSSFDVIVGVASNFDNRLARICRGKPPLSRLQNIFWSAEVGHQKPSPEFFGAIGSRLSLAPHQILFIGDDPTNDVLGGKSAGWRVMHLNRDATNCADGSVSTLLPIVDRVSERG